MAYTATTPCDNRTEVTLILFKDVQNCVELRKTIRTGTIEGALLKASVVLDKFQVLISVNKSVNSFNNNSMTTRNVFTEIIYNMSCSKKITDSLNNFGISDKDNSLLAVVLDSSESEKTKSIIEMVKGTVVDINELSNLADTALVKKIYKVKNEELSVGTLLESVVGRIATKDFIVF